MNLINTADRSVALESIRKEFDFNVAKFPLSGPDNMKTPFYGLFRDDTFEVVGNSSVSKRYVPHQTDDVLALVESAVEAFDCEMGVQCGFKNGHYVHLAPSRDERRAIFGTADNVFPRVLIRSGYDGKAFTASLGFYRDACSNLSMFRSVNSCHVSIRHTSGLRGKMDQLINHFSSLRESWGTLAGVIENMQSHDVRVDEFMHAIYGDSPVEVGRSRTVHENRTRAIINRMLSERSKTGREHRPQFATAWEMYNAVQGYVQHDATRKNGASMFDRIILASEDPAVRAAEATALASLSV